MGPNHRDIPRPLILARMIALLEAAAKEKVMVAFPELALTNPLAGAYCGRFPRSLQAGLALDRILVQ